MGKKDITEKHLEAFADVFADIMNATLFFGTDLKVHPDDLADAAPRTMYKSAGDIREQERDVAKFWKRGNVVLCLLGLENQTEIDPLMPPRVQSYEGGDIRYQMGHWTGPKSTLECMDVAPEL